MSESPLRDTFEAIADCAQCFVEGAVVEIIDGSSGRGVVLESRCRLCAYETREGVVVATRRAVEDAAEARRALVEWAASDGDDDVERFVHANFCGLDLSAVIARLAERKRVETSFDAIAWLFPGVGAVGGGGSASPRSERPARPPSERPTRPPSERPLPDPTAEPLADATQPEGRPSLYGIVSNIPPPMRRSMDAVSSSAPAVTEIPTHKDPARVAARALVAVMMGDGVVDHRERTSIDHMLSTWGYPPMREDDLGPWRPHDLGWPEDPERLIHAMAVLTHVDGERDRSEWRIVREFARAWGYSLDRLEVLGRELEREHTTPSKRFWMDLRSVFIR
ncbi:MAG: hypothetical protein IT379_36335 [Deltaproteobacteria bacterium]|nr:hypothetical protein [Deltaproteobacteria bacterium]